MNKTKHWCINNLAETDQRNKLTETWKKSKLVLWEAWPVRMGISLRKSLGSILLFIIFIVPIIIWNTYLFVGLLLFVLLSHKLSNEGRDLLFLFFNSCISSILHGSWQTYMLDKYMEKAMMTPHSSTLAWKIPWMEEPGGLRSMGSQRVRHDWVTSLSLFTFIHWRRKWQPTPVFLPGESQGWGSLVGCRLWGRTESDMSEVT